MYETFTVDENIDHLSATSQELYHVYVPTIFKAPAKIRMLVNWLEALDFGKTIMAEIIETGLLVETPSGIKRSNPLFVEFQKNQNTSVKLASQLGLAGEIEFDLMDQEYHLVK